MDSLHYTGLIKTYNVNYQTPDSGATATAYLGGIKAQWGTNGVNGATIFEDCSTVLGNEIETVLEKAYKAGKSVGLVTTTAISHASPASAYAKSASRWWYSDGAMMDEVTGQIPDDLKPCKDIATQLFEKSGNITVILAGGKRHFYPNDHDEGRKDGNDFIAEWQQQEDVRFVETHDELFQYASEGFKENRLIGLFSEGHMEFDVDRERQRPSEPSLENMTEIAIQKLSMNPNGYYLFVEGGRIDHGHHFTRPIGNVVISYES